MVDISSSSEPTFLYDAFISYRHVERDRAWAEWLIEALETYKVPRSLVAQGYPPRLKKIFRDEDEMPASGDLNDEIKRALTASRWLIVICSPYTPRSKWVEREIDMFRELGRSENVLALLIEGEPYDAFPTTLLERHRIVQKPDGTHEIVKENAEPLAADVRPRKGVRPAEIKQQALLRLIAPLLGVSFDALRQRDQERRRKALKIALSASLAAILASTAGALAYRDHVRPKTAYFRDFNMQFGLPVGVTPVDAETRARRATTFAIISERGRPVEFRHENSAGHLRDHLFEGEEIAKCRIEYRLDDEVDRLVCSDRWNRYAYHMRYKRDGNRLTIAYERGGAPVTQRATGSLLAGQQAASQNNPERSEITGVTITFDANGFAAEQRFLDPWGVPRQDAEGAYGSRFVNSPTGLVLRRTKIAADGSDLIGRTGVAAVTFSYDTNSQGLGQILIGTDGQPTLGPAGTAGVSYSYDTWGNRIEAVAMGTSGRPVIGPDGYARTASTFDDRGNVVEIRYFDNMDQLIENKRSGCARLTAAFDGRGNRTELRCFDPAGRATIGRDGFHRYTNAFDHYDRWTEWAYFGIDGTPAIHKDGMALRTFVYNAQGNITEIAAFGVDGRPLATADGHAKISFSYNERGERVEEAYFGIDGQSARSRRLGVARVAWTRDARGNEVEIRNYGIDGRPTINRAGYARTEVKRDTRGNIVERRLFGVDDRPIVGSDGWATIMFSFDDRSLRTGESYFGADGSPILTRSGCARWQSRYDERGNRTQSECFGIDGRPLADRNGCFVLRRAFDVRGHQTKQDCLDAAGAPALNRLGFATTTSRYDERGNVLERAWFGIDGRPTLQKDLGIASLRHVYDPRGNLIEVAHFGADSRPILNANGYAKSIAQFDERSNQIVEAFFGLFGEPVLQRGAFARVERVYDARGQLVSARFLDADGRELIRELGVASVQPDSIAARAGVAINDRIVGYDDQKVLAVNQLKALTEQAGFGAPHVLIVRRGEAMLKLEVAPGELGITVRLVAPGEILGSRQAAPRITDTDSADRQP